MNIQDQAAFILHQRPYRDTSQLIELFTRDHGRISAVSRGSRSAKSKLKAVLQPFRPLHVSWSGKGELVSLNKVEAAANKLPLLTGNALPSAFYINELLMKLLHRFDVHSDIYELYQSTLYKLHDHQQLEIHLRLFEKELLQLLGFGLNLTVDADTGEDVMQDASYIYYIEHGPVAQKTLSNQQQLEIRGESLLAFERGEFSDDRVRKEIKSLMRYVLAYYLGGKPLKSRELFR